MARRRISEAATATLEAWLDELLQGQLSIGELPLAVEAWLHVGYSLGRDSRQQEVADLERAVNRLHNLAFTTEPQRRARLEARLSQALDTADETVWTRIEADLQQMAGRQLNTATENLVRAAPAAGKEDHGNSATERSRRAA